MEQDEIVIRKSSGHYIHIILAAVTGVLSTATGGSTDNNLAGNVLYAIGGTAIFLGMLFYTIYEMNKRRVEIAISKKGVYLRRKGLYPWSLIDSFSTVESFESKIELVLHFRDYADEAFEIVDLEITLDEIINLMNAYKLAAAPYNASDYYR